MAPKLKTIWFLTTVNVLAALITLVSLAYIKGMQDSQIQSAPGVTHGVISNRVIPNPRVGAGAHPVFDCSMLRESVNSGEPGMTSIQRLAKDGKTFSNQPVAVHAIVVQAYPKIMGVNWFHLCDRPNGEVLVVSGDEWVEPGAEVIVRGTLSIDRNIGGAYQFPLYIENADLEGSTVQSPKGVQPLSTYDL